MADVFNMRALECCMLRGGTSKGIFFGAGVLPPAGAQRDAEILKIMGSPDIRQIDGLGGAERQTSKIAIIESSTRPGHDIDYLFAQIDPRTGHIEWRRNCGNLAAAAAIYPIIKHMVDVDPRADRMRITIHQANTGRTLLAQVPLRRGFPAVEGNYSIGGVPGTGARIDLDYSDFAGSALGQGVLPTGNTVDRIVLDDGTPLEVTIIDFANLHAFVRHEHVDKPGPRVVEAMVADESLTARLSSVTERVREYVQQKTSARNAAQANSALPMIYLVSAPTDYVTTNGETLQQDGYNIRSFSFANGILSKAHTASGSLALAVAHKIPGSVVAQVGAANTAEGNPVVLIGHPGGVLDASARVEHAESGTTVLEVSMGRTARLLFDGRVFIRD